jgi:hypothetical protein
MLVSYRSICCRTKIRELLYVTDLINAEHKSVISMLIYQVTGLYLMMKHKMYNAYTFQYITGLIKKLNLITQSDLQVLAHNNLKHVLRNLSRFINDIKHLPYHSIG